MEALLAAGLRVREWWPTHRFERAAAAPERAQAVMLQALLHRNAETAFGRKHGFGAIRTVAEYRRAVPLRDLEGAAWRAIADDEPPQEAPAKR